MSEEAKKSAGPQQFEVIEPVHLPVAYVDWFLNVFTYVDNVYVNLGTVDQTRKGANGAPTVTSAAKLRMSRDFATRLHRFLGEELGLTEPPTGDAPKNPAPPNQVMH